MHTIFGIFDDAARQMRDQLSQTRHSLSHALSKGESNEAIVRTFLGERLPRSVGVTRGQLIDKLGSRSKQLDVILYNSLTTPVLWQDSEQSQSLIPSECALAAVEVRTTLSASDMSGIVASKDSVKSLDRSAYFEPAQSPTVQRRVVSHNKINELSPILYHVFAFESINPEQILREMCKLDDPSELDSRIDCVLLLDCGIIAWCHSGDGQWAATSLSDQHDRRFLRTEDALLGFYLLVLQQLSLAPSRAVKLHDYLDGTSH